MVDIIYLVPGVGLSDEEKTRREAVANELVDANVTVVESDGPGPTSIESTVEASWCVLGTLQTLWRIKDDYDAAVIGCFGDPGLGPARELLDIPVIGPAESTIHTATQIGDRYAWLTILDKMKPKCRRLAQEYGLGERCAAVYSVDAPVEDIDHDSEELVDRMIETGQRAVDESGAEVVFPGCMSLSFMQVHETIEEALPVPFVDPATVALEQARSWAIHDISQSKATYPSPKLEKLAELLDEIPQQAIGD